MDNRDVGEVQADLAKLARKLEQADERLRRIEEGLLFIGVIVVAGALTAMQVGFGWWNVVVAPAALLALAYFVTSAMRRTR